MKEESFELHQAQVYYFLRKKSIWNRRISMATLLCCKSRPNRSIVN